MGSLAVAVSLLLIAVLAAIAFGPQLVARGRGLSLPRRAHRELSHLPDPGRALRAERRAERLLASVVGPADYEAYRALGFLYSFGSPEADGEPGYGYLIYPHRPIVSFDARSGELLSELCVSFPDRSEPEHGERLPNADDVLAKWMALRADERALLARANMHAHGRQVDPAQARRDIARLGEWTARPSGGLTAAS
jgi:hypothetical protein